MKNIVGVFFVIGTILYVGTIVLISPWTINLEKNEPPLVSSYEFDEETIHPAKCTVPVPSGYLSTTEAILLPDIYMTGKGFTCTGLAYDEDSDTFIVGEIGALLPGEQIRSSIIRLSADFSKVEETIPLYNVFPKMGDVQGITIDTSNDSIWFCSPQESVIRNISRAGVSISSISINRPTGIAYNKVDDSLWILTYNNEMIWSPKVLVMTPITSNY